MARFFNIKIFSGIKWIAEHAFLISLFLFLISSILGGTIFYKYGILIQGIEPESEMFSVQFKEDLYRDFLREQAIREEKFNAADYKEYPKLFWIDVD